jgi:hypothetical protein
MGGEGLHLEVTIRNACGLSDLPMDAAGDIGLIIVGVCPILAGHVYRSIRVSCGQHSGKIYVTDQTRSS